MRKLTISGENVELKVQNYGTYINGQDLDKLLYRELVENVTGADSSKPFRVMLTIIVEEVDENLIIKNESLSPVEVGSEEEAPW